MKYYFFISLAVATLLSPQAKAGSMGPARPDKDWAWVGTVSAGPLWARGGEAQHFFLTPSIEKTYMPIKSTQALAAAELFIGKQKSLSSQWLGQLGFALATTGNTKLQGLIWDEGDPLFDNHSYQYKVTSTRIAVKGKLLLEKDCGLLPFVSASLGLGFNRAHRFNNTPLIFEALTLPNYEENTNTAFSYTLGAGAQKVINEHWQLGIGYEFADWGKSKLGQALGQLSSSRLTINHLYSNGILFTLSYVA